MTTYPFAALIEQMGNPSASEAAAVLGVNVRSIHRYKAEEFLSVDLADRLAVRAGFHPAEVWPSWWDDQAASVGMQCKECGESFIQGRSDQVYCSMACKHRRKSRLRMRRKWESDPAWMEKERERKRRYKAEIRQLAARRSA